MISRRGFLRTTGVLSGGALARSRFSLDAVVEASASVANQAPADVAKDELYWGQIQQQFALDRTMINLNTGHHCSHPAS